MPVAEWMYVSAGVKTFITPLLSAATKVIKLCKNLTKTFWFPAHVNDKAK